MSLVASAWECPFEGIELSRVEVEKACEIRCDKGLDFPTISKLDDQRNRAVLDLRVNGPQLHCPILSCMKTKSLSETKSNFWVVFNPLCQYLCNLEFHECDFDDGIESISKNTRYQNLLRT